MFQKNSLQKLVDERKKFSSLALHGTRVYHEPVRFYHVNMPYYQDAFSIHNLQLVNI